eukprot:scaffold161_cov172-Amphora_coffeaeformis.AAC.3
MMYKSLLLVWILLFSIVEHSSAGWFDSVKESATGKAVVKDTNKAANQGKQMAQDATAAAKKKAEEAKKKSQQVAEDAKKKAQQAAEDAKKKGKEVAKEGRSFFGVKK